MHGMGAYMYKHFLNLSLFFLILQENVQTPSGRCSKLHDRETFMETKLPDIAEECPVLKARLGGCGRVCVF